MGRRRVDLILMCIALSLFLNSCSSKEEIFPSLQYPSDETEETQISDETDAVIPGDITEIVCALPYSDTTVNRLIKYYYGTTNGLIGRSMSGSSIDLDYLDSIDIPWIVGSVPVSGDGASVSSFGEDEMPDIILVNDIDTNRDDLIPLNDILAMNSGFSEGNIYIDAFEQSTVDDVIYGIPHYAAFTVFVGNLDFVPEGGRIGYLPSSDELDSYVRAINEQYGEEGVIAFTGADSSWEGSLRAFSDAFYEEEIARDLDDENADPRYARNAAIWPASSGNASVWEDYYPDNIYYFRVPQFEDGSDDLMDIYSIGITRSCSCPELCADIARFISYDTNALLLIERLESPSGYFPLVTNNMVWNRVRGQGGVNTIFTEDSYE